MVVVGGYLGAGKTTLLNYLLTHTQGYRIAVLVNDFGEINIDATLIRSRSNDVIQLENGCVCCTIGDKLVQALDSVSSRSERPDLLVIEASGVSDPTRIAQVGMLDRDFQLTAVVVAVDCTQLAAHLNDPLVGDMVRRQINGATALVLTKADLADNAFISQTTVALAAIAPRAAFLRATHGKIPLSVYLDSEAVTGNPQHREIMRMPILDWRMDRKATDILLNGGISSFAYHTDSEFDKQKLRQVLRELPGRVLRAKGIVQFHGVAVAQELHVVGGRLRLSGLPVGETVQSTLVFIGCFTPEEEEAIRGRLNSSVWRSFED
jgi:G3E family GTPase